MIQSSPRSQHEGGHWEDRGIIQSKLSDYARIENSEMLVLFGIPIHNLTQKECVDGIIGRARSGIPGQVVTANLDFALQAWRDPEMHRIPSTPTSSSPTARRWSGSPASSGRT
jgi:hypothetical protein